MDAVKIYEDAVRRLEKSEITLGEFVKLIEPLRDVSERKTGKWIQDQKSKRYRCDQCLSFALKTDDMQENLSDFCPVCGAMMEGEQP